MCPSQTIQITFVSNSTKDHVIANTEYGNTTFLINWDLVFNGLNHKYRKATIRSHLSGTLNIAKDTVSDATGYLSVVGLASPFAYSFDMQGIILSDLQYANSSQISSDTGYYLNSDTRGNVVAPMCYTPTGVLPFTVRISQESGAVMDNANLSPWALTLVFELFDAIEPEMPSNQRGPILPLAEIAPLAPPTAPVETISPMTG